jgi:uncharacterized protein (TIGR00251 family)
VSGPVFPTAGGVGILLHVQPGAKRTEPAGLHGDALKLRVAAPPVDGAANAAIEEFLARRLGVPRRAVRLVAGASGRRKRVEVDGVSIEAARGALGLDPR